MQCPRCLGNDTSPVGDSHYICNNENCVDEKGNRTQFQYIEDEKISFPYNQIFVNKSKNNFYKKPYLKQDNIGASNINR